MSCCCLNRRSRTRFGRFCSLEIPYYGATLGGVHMMQNGNRRTELSRREWMLAAGGLLIATRGPAQFKLLPLNSSGLDHVSITVPDAVAAASFYGKIFDPQVFHERTGVQRYYVRIGSAYLVLGPQANATPYIDPIATGVIDFVKADFAKPEIKDQVT